MLGVGREVACMGKATRVNTIRTLKSLRISELLVLSPFGGLDGCMRKVTPSEAVVGKLLVLVGRSPRISEVNRNLAVLLSRLTSLLGFHRTHLCEDSVW